MDLIYERKGEIAYLTLNRPQVLNALNFSLLNQLHEQLSNVKEKVVILTGAGNKAFVAGADISEMEAMSKEKWVEYCRLGRKALSLLECGSFISIAAVNGFAYGGGMELALACDLIIASDKASFGLPEVKLGVIPSFSGIPRLSRALGKFRAAEWLLTGKSFTAAEAKEMGVVNRVCSPDQLLTASDAWANDLLQNSFEAMMGVKKVMQGKDEESTSLHCFAAEDRKGRMEAFLKRKKHA